MNTDQLRIALGNTAGKVRQINVTTEAEHALLRDAADLLRVLANVVSGTSHPRAFGAPGDWGYDTEIGMAVLALHREHRGAQSGAASTTFLSPVKKRQLELAFEAWETGYRIEPSKFRPPEECAWLNVSQVSAERADYFFELLVIEQAKG